MVKFELVDGGRKTKIALNKVMSRHRIAVQKAMAESMTRTRVKAEEYIIPNTAKYSYGKLRGRTIYSPRMARAIQPSVSGRLTSRTGKIKYMLRHSASIGNPLRGWGGWGRKLAKQRSVAFLSQVRAESTTLGMERYIGTIRVNVRGDSKLFDTTKGQPPESLKTLAVRFQWEYGIRGQKRPIFAPVAKQTDYDMRRLVQQKNNLIWRL